MIEAIYQAQWTKWWTVQPEMQYIIRPGGGVLNSGGSLRPNALVIAFRSTISF
jgi:porin